MIFQVNIADRHVNNAKNFSKFVFAKMFPNVFKTNSPKKIHKIISIVLIENLNFTKLPFINKIQDKNTFMSIEIVSNTYI